MRTRSRFQEPAELRELVGAAVPTGFVLVDGGARSGAHDLQRIASLVDVYGFEPNAPEAELLVELDGPYRSARYLPLALLGQTGSATLFVSRRPGATSTLRPNRVLLETFATDNWSQMADVVGEVVVEGVSLGDYLAGERLGHIDLLKLDTQGNELDILRSLGERLSSVSVVKVEVELISVYEGQALIGDVCSFLAANGFELVDIGWTDTCRRFHFSPDLPPDAYRLVWADALFALAPHDRSRPRKLEQAIVLAELGMTDIGLSILSEAPGICSEARTALVEFYQRRLPPQSSTRLKRALFSRMPPNVIAAYRALRAGTPSKQVVSAG